MAQTPKPSARKGRAHLPRLTPAALELFLQGVQTLPISEAGKRAVAQSIQAAANPDAESPDVVIRTLDKEEQKAIANAAQDYQRTLGGVTARGTAALMAMTDAEWERLLNDLS